MSGIKYAELEEYYLCGIGINGVVNNYRIGRYDKKREGFSFSNGAYSNTELYKEPVGSNATYVVTAICLQELHDLELLEPPKETKKKECIGTGMDCEACQNCDNYAV